MKVTVFLISILISLNALSETYVCSQELSKFNRPGEVETIKYERKGYGFTDSIIDYQIFHESESHLILTKLFTFNSPSLYVFFINKETNEWGGSANSMNEFKIEDPDPHTYGKCVVVN
tara:strand:+ start:287 stop:640 length:354 start_codon:yes stop_codon:yes gene_type:complete